MIAVASDSPTDRDIDIVVFSLKTG